MAQKEEKTLSLKSKIIRSCIVFGAIGLFLTLIYFVLVWTGLWENINSVEKIRHVSYTHMKLPTNSLV